jgi:hypothetical protein
MLFSARHGCTGCAFGVFLYGCLPIAAAETVISKTDRGARIDTERFTAVIRDGVLAGFFNKHTHEEYLDPSADLQKLQRHVPSGLGTQHGDEGLAAADRLYHWPWWEHPHDSTWPNQHYPSADSTFDFTATGADSGVLVYTGLTNGSVTFADESYTLAVEIEAGTGDLLITPAALSPRAGVYAANLTVAPLAPTVTAEAPIFDGVRLDRDMPPKLWANAWGGYWDYAFLALNGDRRGAVGIWTQDTDLKFYKTLFYLVDEQGLSFSFSTMNVPPFEGLKEAKPLPWRLQAFDTSWAQAATRFRDWRVKNQRIATRPAWAGQVSFFNSGVSARRQEHELLDRYFEGKGLDRTVTFAPMIRRQPFDVNHTDNAYYDAFPEEMKAWKKGGPRLMAYLQPMIMWTPKPETQREKDGLAFSKAAETRTVFQQTDGPVKFIDQHHLGEPRWQRWFLDWCKEYVDKGGAHGIYHDQSYHCPIDRRGLAVNGMTSVQGMADYFYKVQTENPTAIQGTEHLTEVNNVGATLAIAGGVHWGTAQSMRHQRVDHPSPVAAALAVGDGVLCSFPHQTNVFSNSPLDRFHWGMNLSEGRAEIAGAFLHQIPGPAMTAGFETWVNEYWLQRKRDTTFVWRGLRPVFPEQWDRRVLSYFRAADGGDFRYVRKPWGTAFVEVKNEQEAIVYGRFHGADTAVVGGTGAITGWPMYKSDGPSGMHPDRYYVYDPEATRPVAYFKPAGMFSPGLYEGYVNEGFIGGNLGWMDIKPIERIGALAGSDRVALVAPERPKALWVEGRLVTPTPVEGKPGEWGFGIELRPRARVCVLFQDVPASLEEAARLSYGRQLQAYSTSNASECGWVDQQRPTAAGEDVVVKTKDGSTTLDCPRNCLFMPIRLPEGAGKGIYRMTAIAGGKAPIKRIWINGVEQEFVHLTNDKQQESVAMAVPLSAAAPEAVVGVHAAQRFKLVFTWEESR